METAILVVWPGGWLALTVFFATLGETEDGLPLFVTPLLFGSLWPGILAAALVFAPFFWLSDRAAAKRKTLTPADGSGE